MSKENKRRPLRLARTTIRNLTRESLEEVVGGRPGIDEFNSDNPENTCTCMDTEPEGTC